MSAIVQEPQRIPAMHPWTHGSVTVRARVVGFLALAVLCLAPVGLAAQSLKIGFVDSAQVLQEAPQAESASQRLQEEFSGREEDLNARQQEVRKLREKVLRDSAIMSDDQRRRLERDVKRRIRELELEQQELQEDLELARQEEMRSLQQEIVDVISAIAEQRDYDLVLTNSVIYASDRANLTQAVLDRLKARN